MFGGVVNDNLVFPIIDLIRREMRDKGNGMDGMPSVKLYREHPMDDEIMTSATLTYESGMVEEIGLTRGSDDVSTYPEGLKPRHPDYKFCQLWRLTQVSIIYVNPGGEPIAQYQIGLFYDKRGLLDHTTVNRM